MYSPYITPLGLQTRDLRHILAQEKGVPKRRSSVFIQGLTDYERLFADRTNILQSNKAGLAS